MLSDLTYRWLAAQSYPAIISNIFGELPRGNFYSAAEVTAPQQRNHRASSIARARIIYNRLQAVTNLNSIFSLIRRNQQQHAAILLLTPNAQLLIKVHRIILDALPLERMHGDNGHLRTGFLFKLSTKGFQLRLCVWLNRAGKVRDIAGRMNFLDVFGSRCAGKCEHQAKQCDET
jgi:hypothetical protein